MRKKNKQETWTHTSENIETANKPMYRYLNSLVISKMHMKTMWDANAYPPEWLK